MAAEREYKQRCDNPAILSAVKASSCEMCPPIIRLFEECRPGCDPVPSHPGTNITSRPATMGLLID